MESLNSEDKERRNRLLHSIGVKEFFEDGSIWIDRKTCKGLGCQLCIKACPTKAIYWRAYPGEVRITKELCVFCTSCVWKCTVDDCIQVRRKRPNGEVEKFSNPREVLKLLHKINAKERGGRVKSRLEWTREIPSIRKIRRLSTFLRRSRLVKK